MADYTYTPDNLEIDIEDSQEITVASGQGELSKGTLLISLSSADYVIADSTDTIADADYQTLVVLAEDIDATSAAVTTVGYTAGKFDRNYMTFGGTDTYATWEGYCRLVDIKLKAGATNALDK